MSNNEIAFGTWNPKYENVFQDTWAEIRTYKCPEISAVLLEVIQITSCVERQLNWSDSFAFYYITFLSSFHFSGETQLILKHSVTWTIGDLVVLASTSRSPQENEELNITSVSNGGRIIGVTPPLKYKHISVVQKIAGRTVKTRAEVGLLSRNVVVEGSENDEWKEKIEECQEGFNPGQFAVHTCFQGRYGDTMGSEQFGSQIMINARMKSEGLVTGRISYVEVRKAGQAFGLGLNDLLFY